MPYMDPMGYYRPLYPKPLDSQVKIWIFRVFLCYFSIFFWGVPLLCGLVFSLPELVVSPVFFQEFSGQYPFRGKEQDPRLPGTEICTIPGRKKTQQKKRGFSFGSIALYLNVFLGNSSTIFQGFQGLIMIKFISDWWKGGFSMFEKKLI